MRQIELLKACTLVLSMAFATGIALTGCAEKDLYDPNFGKQELPAPETLPDFSNWSAINLSVDYEMPGCKTLIEVYAEYPYETQADGSVVKTTKLPLFAAYTDDNAKYSGKLTLPAATKTVYLCTSAMGLPGCIGLDVTSQDLRFKRSDLYQDDAQTRASVESPEKGKAPYLLDSGKKLYSLCQWGRYGKPSKGYITDVKETVPYEWIESIQKTLWNGKDNKNNLDNTDKLVEEKYTNITIAKEFVNNQGQTVVVKDAGVTLTFLQESGFYQNTLGYYFYPGTDKPKSPAQLKKYVIFPNASTAGSVPFVENNWWKKAPLQFSSQITLKYINETTGEVSDRFPAGYTIGWFLISDAFASDDDDDNELNTDAAYLYSNESWNVGNTKRCLALNDQKSGRVIVGFEDGGDKSCEDVLFFVESDPRGAILDPDKPNIDDDGDIDMPDKTFETKGTLAFEDNWPAQGDYDMNDVAVTYSRIVSFNAKNQVTKIVDTFAPVQRANAAVNTNAFAFQVADGQVGTYTELPVGTIYEEATRSFILFPNAQLESGKEFVITRTFNAAFTVDALVPNNPFIIINYVAGNTKRAEVHLPKKSPTNYANPALIGADADAYYVDRDGKHPFAIDIPAMNFGLVTEKRAIGTEGEYPTFTNWVANGCKPGAEYSNWYEHRK